MGIWSKGKAAYGALERRAGWLLVGGVALAALWNARQWRRDRRRLRELEGQKGAEPVLGEGPLVSILLPAWKEAGNLGPCIESILGLRYPNKELIVCAGGGDGTLEVARSYEGPGIVVLEQAAGEGKQGALRRSFARSTGEIIYLTDADCIVDDGAFEATLAPIIAGGEEAATGAWRPLDRQVDRPFVQYQWAHHVYREVWLPEHVPTLGGANAVVRREALERAGAFEVPAPIGTDYVLSKQLAASRYRIRFVRGSHVQTEYPERARDYWRQQSRWFRNRMILGRQWGGEDQIPAHLRGGIAAWFLLAVPAVGGLGSKLLWAAWLVAVFHLTASHARYLQAAQPQRDDQPRVTLNDVRSACYMVVGWAAMAKGLADTVLPSRWVSW